VTKKASLIMLCLILAITSFGWFSAEASSSTPAPSARARKSVQKKNKKSTRRYSRRTSRRRGSSLRLARVMQALQEQAQAAIARDDLRGEDPEVRQAVIAAMSKHAGTAVVMDPHTGRIYSIVNQDWALRQGFVPCSTIKPFIALAGLKENLIAPSLQMGTGQGSLSLGLIDALSRSDNPYFQRIGQSLGLFNLRRYVSQFGLGQLTGINLPGETPGRIPGGENVNVAYASSHGKGFEVTPLQLAVFTAALANQGFMYQPQVVSNELQSQPAGYGEGSGGGNVDGDSNADPSTPVLQRQFDLSPVERINIIAGMIGAVEFGTARLSYDPTIQVAGKTGTCTGENGLRLGLYESFANVDQPKLVVIVVTQGVHERGPLAAQIAGRIYQQLADRFELRSAPPKISSK
jgi:penicillin-binding protein 2